MDKNNKKKYMYLLFLLILALFIIDYYYIDKFLNNTFDEKEYSIVSRVIDGDTIVLEDGTHVRLLGINTPEKNEKYSEESTSYLGDLVLNKSVYLEKGRDDRDRYNRSLRYIYLGNDKGSVNEKLVENGYANYYFPSGYDQNSYAMINAWKKCINEKVNLCKKSEDVCGECIKLEKLDVQSQEVILKNECSLECDLDSWSLKDEGRKIYKFKSVVVRGDSKIFIKVGEGEDTYSELFWHGESYVWTRRGDTLFLRDSKGDLVLWKGY